MAAKIPQDVTREDRLIGPLTLRQFLYVLAGGALVFIAYQYMAQGYLFMAEFVIIAFTISALTLALTFGKINGIGFGQFMLNLYVFLRSPKLRRWSKSEEAPLITTGLPAKNDVDKSATAKSKPTNQSQLEILATVLDTGGKMNQTNQSSPERVGNLGANITTIEEPSVDDVLKELD